MQPVFIVIAIIVIGAVAYYAWRQEQKRREALLLWATGRGWKLRVAKQKRLHDRWAGLKILRKGHTRRGKNVITGTFDGFTITLLDYQYVTGHGKNRSTHNKGLVILGCDHPTIPLQIRRENPFDKVGEFLGMDDIDFESAEFSRKFYVKSPDKKWAYDVIHGRTMEFLLKSPRYFSIAFGHNEIAVMKSSRCQPVLYEQAIKLASDLYELIPDYVLEQLKGK